MARLFSLMVLGAVALSATAEDKAATLKQFEEDGRLMVNICGKLSQEREVAKLNKVALGLQTNRTINCIDVAGECKAYTEFLAQAIRASKKGEISDLEQAQLSESCARIRSLVEKAKRKLKAP